MGIDTNRAAMLGTKAELKDRIDRLIMQAESCCDSISGTLNHCLAPVEELEVPKAAAEMDQLVMIYGELIAAREQLRKINRALGCN
jgi:hypothetical protein